MQGTFSSTSQHSTLVWRRDVLIVALSAALGVLLGVIGPWPFQPPASVAWLRITLFVALCLVELLRRRAPMTALILGSALMVADGLLGSSLAMWLVYCDLLYAATLHGSRRFSRWMLPGVTLTTVVGTAAALIFLPHQRITVLLGLGVLAAVTIPVGWAVHVREHQEIAEAERVNAVQLARINELDRTAAANAERARMARDLHDVVSGHLSAIAIQSEAALSINDNDPDTARTVLVSVRQNSVRALEEMRALIELLRAGGAEAETTSPRGLAELPQLAESAWAAGTTVEVDASIDDAPLPTAVDLAAYRIAQEALTNVLKHAPHTKTSVTVRRVRDMLTVEVMNELPAQPVEPQGRGTGLLNMRERAAAVGGSLTAGPSESGWLVRASLPVSGAKA